MLPSRVKICGHEFTVAVVPIFDLDGTTGEVEANMHRIRIAAEVPETLKESTLLHELIEITSDKFELGLSHPTIQCLEEVLYQVLKDNKLAFVGDGGG